MEERFASDDLVYDGRIARVHRVGVRMDDGEVVTREMVQFPGAALVLPVLDDGGIVLIRNVRFAVGESLYELPAGMLEPDESPHETAVRELSEETGYSAACVEKLGQFYTSPGVSDEVMHVFLATDLTDGPQRLERYEQITVEVVADAEVRRMVAGGRIHDGKTIAALALHWLRQGGQ
jgi:ADP-ribose pyrophosphatase